VEDEIVVAGRSVAWANVTAAVRCSQLLSCSKGDVRTPEVTFTEQCVPAFSIAVFAVNVNVAVDVPVLAEEAAKLVVPHPVPTGVESEEKVKVGSTKLIASSTETGVFNSNVKDVDVSTGRSADVIGLAKTNALYVRAGATTAVDVLIDVAAISCSPASVAPIVREGRSAACPVGLVVTPDAIDTVHNVPEGSKLPAVVRFSTAADVPE
jgi:hypothetical protein